MKDDYEKHHSCIRCGDYSQCRQEKGWVCGHCLEHQAKVQLEKKCKKIEAENAELKAENRELIRFNALIKNNHPKKAMLAGVNYDFVYVDEAQEQSK